MAGNDQCAGRGHLSHYEVLGVGEDASDEQIRLAYRQLAKTAHPDAGGDPERFRVVTEAYDVLSDPQRRAAYDNAHMPAWAAATPAGRRRRRRGGRYLVLLVVVLALGGGASLVVATMRQSVGDHCLVGAWRGDAFEVPFRGVLDGREVAATLRGGAGSVLTVLTDGRVRVDYGRAAPLVAAEGAVGVEGVYAGTSIERWEADDGRVTTRSDASGVTFQATINGRVSDQPLGVTVVDGDYPYTCTPTRLEFGPYRYTRV